LKNIYRLILSTVYEFLKLRCLEAGASIAFYALFSLFPLVIILISSLGFFLDQSQVHAEVLRLLTRVFPATAEKVSSLVENNLGIMFTKRGSVSILAGIGLFWSGSNVFNAIVRNINLAWHTKMEPLTILRDRLLAFAMITILAVVILLSFVYNPILNLISHFNVPFGQGRVMSETTLWGWFSRLPSDLLTFVLFFSLYWWIPKVKVRWREAFLGALVAVAAWRLAILGFTWSIRAGVLNYQVIYGSLASVLITMIWIYISSLILLFGAHLGAAYARLYRPEEEQQAIPSPS
jgi:membrane protein